jgi:hypothetical protein
MIPAQSPIRHDFRRPNRMFRPLHPLRAVAPGDEQRRTRPLRSQGAIISSRPTEGDAHEEEQADCDDVRNPQSQGHVVDEEKRNGHRARGGLEEGLGNSVIMNSSLCRTSRSGWHALSALPDRRASSTDCPGRPSVCQAARWASLISRLRCVIKEKTSRAM